MIKNEIRILASGDSILRTKDKSNPYQHIDYIFQNYDYVIINLETAIIQRNRTYKFEQKSVVFYIFEEDLQWLRKYKTKFIFTLANNHIYDCGEEGYRDTLRFLNNNNFSFVQQNKPLFITENSPNICVNAVYDEIQNEHTNEIIRINNTFSDDIVNILCIHWGQENVLIPSLKQIDMAHCYFKNGVDIVIGHHSHTPQGRLLKDNKVCAFSLGNFNMQRVTGEQREMVRIGLMLEIAIAENKQLNSNIIPVYLDDSFSPNMNKEVKYKSLPKKLDELIPNSIKFNRLKYRLSYEAHISKNNIIDNVKFGWIPRIKKFGFNHFLQMLRWFISKNFLKSLCFLPFNRFQSATKLMKTIND